ncbi:MAG: chorismate-binding protein [Succinivibrionaceae bacterium]
MILLVDNYDSFTYNLIQYLGILNQDFKIIKNDELILSEIIELEPRGIILSPGPGSPQDAGISSKIVEYFDNKCPILGICLGHQVIVESSGGTVDHAPTPMHGKISNIKHKGTGIFTNIPSSIHVTRYHSLTVTKLPNDYEITAITDTEPRVVMGVQHKNYPVFGVQFHIEALETEYGLHILKNFCDIVNERKILPRDIKEYNLPVNTYKPVINKYLQQKSLLPNISNLKGFALEIITPSDFTTLDCVKIFENEREFKLLDSQENEITELNRYSIFAFNPILRVENHDGENYLETFDGLNQSITDSSDALECIEQIIKTYSIKVLPPLPNHISVPFVGGFIGHISYEYYRVLFEDKLGTDIFLKESQNLTFDDSEPELPLLSFSLYENAIIYDKKASKWFITSIVSKNHLEKFKNRVLYKIKEWQTSKVSKKQNLATSLQKNTTEPEVYTSVSDEEYIEDLNKIHEFIKDGKVYQINYTQRFDMDYTDSPSSVYEKLIEINSSPFGGLFISNDYSILSTSPERFIQIKDNKISTRPIKGTIQKTGDEEQDAELKEQLRNSAKDRSELLMIVDLERNDFGKICEYGSICVPKQFIIEEYPTLFHLVSEINGVLRKGTSIKDIFMSCFPGGSITGAPKLVAIQCINLLERVPRSVYTGTMGYIDISGNIDLNIVIRTIILKNNKAYFSAGGGIVWDSDNQSEYEESLLKAQALMDSLCGE